MYSAAYERMKEGWVDWDIFCTWKLFLTASTGPPRDSQLTVLTQLRRYVCYKTGTFASNIVRPLFQWEMLWYLHRPRAAGCCARLYAHLHACRHVGLFYDSFMNLLYVYPFPTPWLMYYLNAGTAYIRRGRHGPGQGKLSLSIFPTYIMLLSV